MEEFRKSNALKRKILIVDDELINREILGNILSGTYDVTYANDGIQAFEVLKDSGKYSLILLDLLMPNMDGFEFLLKWQSDEKLKSIPVIVMTSEKEAEVKSINMGAADFITKPYDMPEVILARVKRIIELFENSNIIRSAERDSLTGLYSKDLFFEYIRQIEALSASQDKPMDAVVLDVEHFHLINEIYGRAEGDKVLIQIAGLIQDILKNIHGIACRADADTFYIYSNHTDNPGELLNNLGNDLADIFQNQNIRLRAGIYEKVDKTIIPENRYDRAKRACDRIKNDYTRSVSYYNEELHEKSIYHEKLIRDIETSIKNKDFTVYFQPKYGILEGRPKLRSAEALIRWNHPQMGMISPGDFVPLFESNGLIQKVDDYVWREAARKIKEWKDKYHITIPVSVNVSRIDIYDPNLENNLIQILESNNLTPNEYMLEITESAYSDNADRLVEVVNNMRSRGFKVEMDDFGTGYSSLNMLTTIPIDVLKMDMKFVRNMLNDDKSLHLVELIMDIARFLKVPVVAEGVETEEQLNVLKGMNCDIIQGYYFSKPVCAEDFEILIQKEVELRKEEV